MLQKLKTPGIPLWVTLFALLTFVFGAVLGLMAFFGPMPGFENVDPSLAASWGGRALGIGLAALLAVFLRSPDAYIVAFAAGAFRDIGDIVGEFGRPQPSMGVLVVTFLFLAICIYGISVAFKARKSMLLQ